MEKTDVIVIGAGAAGLMAAYHLSKKGKKVTVLEARNRLGGRIHTVYNQFGKTELGAEFIHGDLPLTLALLKEAGIAYSPAGGELLRFKNGKLTREDEQTEGWDELLEKMAQLNEDVTLNSFLNEHFPGNKYEILQDEVRRYVAGFDTADPDKASVFALREEWGNEDEDAQHRLDNGYGGMINYLAGQLESSGGGIIFNSPVKQINRDKENVVSITESNKEYIAAKLIIALPLGVLQTGELKFEPPMPEYQTAFGKIGFGSIIKILLRFKSRFWEENKEFGEAAFVLLKEQIPTWWTQAPAHENLLTGWLGGNPSKKFDEVSEDELLETALKSLANIFSISTKKLRSLLLESYIINWNNEPFTLGSYAYDKIGSHEARQLINTSVANTIYFAGEYLYEGAAMGTVEAALTSGKNVAEMINAKHC